ncbi:MAG: YcxB family protein [Sphaerochaetaceae bacterium]
MSPVEMKQNRIACRIDSKVYGDFLYFHAFWVSNQWALVVFFPLFMLGFGVVNYITGSYFLSIVFFVLAVLFPLYKYMVFLKVKKKQIGLYKLDTNPRVFYEISFDEEALHVSNEKEQASYPWKKIYGVFETPHYYFWYVTKINSFIIPKLCINEYDDVRKYLSPAFLKECTLYRYRNIRRL